MKWMGALGIAAFAIVGCGDDATQMAPSDAALDAPMCSGSPGETSLASCSVGTPNPQQCIEYTGGGWTASSADESCTDAFSTEAPRCPSASRVGRCLRYCGTPHELVEAFYSNGPTTFTAELAEGLCEAYRAADLATHGVAPTFLAE